MTKCAHPILMLSMATLLGFAHNANAAEVKVLSDEPLEPALTKLTERFRTESGHRLTFVYGLSPVISRSTGQRITYSMWLFAKSQSCDMTIAIRDVIGPICPSPSVHYG